jgi:hypothetical protein
MKKELQILLLFSIVICLWTMTQMLFNEKVEKKQDHFASGIALWKPPVLKKEQNQSFNNNLTATNPFAERFFEKALLQGFMKNQKNEWCAVFSGPENQSKLLQPQTTWKGLTLIKADGRTCKVRFGAVVREFGL